MATGLQAQQAADLHAEELASYPNVVGIGTSPLAADRAATGEDEHAVAVYVSRKVPAAQLDDRQRLPDHVELLEAGQVVRVPVIVVATGAFEPENSEPDNSGEPGAYRGFTTE